MMENEKAIELLKFDRRMFEDESTYPKGWHLMNTAAWQQGEFTLCGTAFDGDATSTRYKATFKQSGKVTCERCLSIIKLCKTIKL